jgi:predicted RNA binding protein YcfA (HicA-like mRNA interferase family)
VKRRALERLLREAGAIVKREGGEHTIWMNPKTGQKSSVPRHAEIKKHTARAICKDLGIDPQKVTS